MLDMKQTVRKFNCVALPALLLACGSAHNPDAPAAGGDATAQEPIGSVSGGSTSSSPSGGAAGSSVVATAGSVSAAGTTTSSGASGASSGGSAAGASAGAGSASSEPFSFFLTSVKAMVRVSGNQAGFGGDFRFGETGPGAGLRGADKICSTIAETSMPGNGKTWRAFLSATAGEHGEVVNAIDRVGDGPWYDRLGRLVAANKADLGQTRPLGADPAIINDLPNEDGVPNHDPDGSGDVDNHDTLTGSNATGQLYSSDPNVTCNDWTSKESSGAPRVGHSWPRASGPGMGGGRGGGSAPGGGDGSGENWMSALTEAGCAPGIFLVEAGPPGKNGTKSVGDGGGYGGIYCFALSP